MKQIIVSMAFLFMPVDGHADSCVATSGSLITSATVRALDQLYDEYDNTIKSQKDMDAFLKNMTGPDHDGRPKLADITIGEGMDCSPDFCHAYVRVDPTYLRNVLNDALTKRLTDIRCSIMKLGAELPH
jgi:hypothetical protein